MEVTSTCNDIKNMLSFCFFFSPSAAFKRGNQAGVIEKSPSSVCRANAWASPHTHAPELASTSKQTRPKKDRNTSAEIL